jgi:glycosyltransferase involved in cell wall biosynthesis
MKVAIIAFNHPESSIVLAKYLGQQGIEVDYYYITWLGVKEVSAFNFSNSSKWLGVSRVDIDASNPLNKYIANSNLSVNIVRLSKERNILRILNLLILFVACQKLKKGNYDIINLVGQNELLLSFYRYMKESIFVHTLHEPISHYKEQHLKTQLIEHILQNNIPIIVHSNFVFDKFTKNIKSKESLEKINIIPFGLFETYDLYSNKEQPHNNLYFNILFYGFIRPYKGLDTLLKAMYLVHQEIPNARLIIAGSGSLAAYDSELLNKSYITIYNKILSNSELVCSNRNAHVIVCPYKSASQSGIVATSFMFGKPVIASDVGAFKEAISNNYSGMLIPPNNENELASALIKVIKDEDYYQSLKNGVDEVKNNSEGAWQIIAKKTKKLYENVIQGI